MADIKAQIAEAEQNISTARQKVAEQRQKVSEYRKQAQSIQTPARDINFQQNVIRKNPRFFAGRTEQIIGQRKRIRRESLAQADIADKELDIFESNVLAPAQAEVESVKAQVAEQEAIENEYKIAERYASKGIYPFYEGKRIRKLYSQIKEGYDARQERNKTIIELKAQGLNPIYSGGQITGFEDSKLGMSYSLDNIPSSFTSMRSPAELKKLEKVGFTLEQKQIETPEFQLLSSQADLLPGTTSQALEKKSLWGNIVSKYDSANKFIKEKVTAPIGNFIFEKTGLTAGKFSKLSSLGASSIVGIGPIGLGGKENMERSEGRTEALITNLKEKPLGSVATLGLSFVGGAVVGGITRGAGAISPTLGAVTRTGTSLGGFGLTGLYTYDVGKKVYTAENPKDIGRLEGKALQDVVLFGVGYKRGTAVSNKVAGRLATIGRTEVIAEELILPDILSGKKQFVESSSYGYKGSLGKEKQLFDLSIFGKQGYGYHTTGETFWKGGIEIQKGKSEFQGLYLAPSPSVYFLRGSETSSKLLPSLKDLFGSSGKPGVAKIYTEFGIKGVGETGKKGKAGSLEFLGNLKAGKAYVSGVKPEIESILPYGLNTQVTKKGGNQYFKYRGQRVPIDVFEATGKDILGGSSKQRSSTDKSYRLSSYTLPRSSPYLMPEVIGSLYYSSKRGSSKSNTFSSRNILYPSSRSSGRSSGSSLINYKSFARSPPKSTSYYPTRSPAGSSPKSTSYYPTRSPPKNPSRKPPIQSRFRLSFGEKVRKSVRGYRQPLGYLPSFSALVLNLRASSRPIKIMGGYLPGIRPIIVRRKRIKRRRR